MLFRCSLIGTMTRWLPAGIRTSSPSLGRKARHMVRTAGVFRDR